MRTDALPWVWGATRDEAARPYPADQLVAGRVSGPVLRMTRAVSVRAPVEMTWRWICQLREAPYSYDLVDNLGRRSPTELTTGSDDLRLGRRMVMVYELTSVVPGRSWTGVTSAAGSRPFGPLAATYAAEPAGATQSRLVCRMVLPDGGPVVRAKASALAWGDLVMLRKQLLTLAAYAGRDAAREAARDAARGASPEQ